MFRPTPPALICETTTAPCPAVENCHPKNVYLREADVPGQVDDWLAELFLPDSVDATVSQIAEQAALLEDPETQAGPKPLGRASPTRTPRSAATGRAPTSAETPP